MDPVEHAEWNRCRRAASKLVLWWDRRAQGDDDAAAVDPSPATMRAFDILALALWRASATAQLPIDTIDLLTPVAWLPASDPEALWRAPLPEPPPRPDHPWTRLRGHGEEPVALAGRILTDHAEDALDRQRRIGEAGSPTPISIGVRLRDLASQERARRATAAQVSTRADQVAAQLRGRDWAPSAADRWAAALILTSIQTEPDNPPAPDAGSLDQPTWLQRLVWIVHLGTTAQSVIDTSRTSDTTTAYGWLLLNDIAAAGDDLAETASELDTAWAAHSSAQPLPAWEREQIPMGLREEILSLETALRRAGDVLAAVINADQS